MLQATARCLRSSSLTRLRPANSVRPLLSASILCTIGSSKDLSLVRELHSTPVHAGTHKPKKVRRQRAREKLEKRRFEFAAEDKRIDVMTEVKMRKLEDLALKKQQAAVRSIPIPCSNQDPGSQRRAAFGARCRPFRGRRA
jgi:hypothetical protein